MNEITIDPEITLWSMDHHADDRRTEAYRRQTMQRLKSYAENHGATETEETHHGLHLIVRWKGDLSMRRAMQVALHRFCKGYGEIVS